ncbi:hypothetical protein N4P33_18335 [Streptomyces sp. 15-116A]|uniref:hypothetical protein n=1 Tax=Streptomyces sp. 15-116A TaxID=2259035 RepID=UPI0021B1AA28|nr:hypothetical protein [Streptomyces sp. 15-116A]MCT7354101.1 hypothetical protein [Streptomyces sp. 15-116A]
MATHTANEDSRLSLWRRVREYAVPPSMIETATARRTAGDWAGACAAARVDVDLDLRSLARTHGRELTSRIRADLRHLAPDLLRWHMPRIAPDGLLRPGLTLSLARYATGDDGRGRRPGPVHLVVRTPPAWAEGGQRMSLALWDGDMLRACAPQHPHPRPGARFRLDLHRHLWDATRAGELRVRAGADAAAASGQAPDAPGELLPPGRHCAVDRWADEARIVLRDTGRSAGAVAVRLGAGHRLLLRIADAGEGPAAVRIERAAERTGGSVPPVLPHAATHVLPDLELLRAGTVDAGRLHPSVATALVPGHVPSSAPRPHIPQGRPQFVRCRGAQHRIGLVDGVLTPLDHDPDEIRREELLAELTGTPLPCLRAVDLAHRRPDCLEGVRERLDHGDIAGALDVVEHLLGPGARLRSGPLRDELEAAAHRRLTYGLYRSGLSGPAPGRIPPNKPRPGDARTHPRQAGLR